MYRTIEIARYIIDYCTKMGTPVSNLQLQKILYYLQVQYAKENIKLFNDDIYAWPYGPVVPNVYYSYGGYGGASIKNEYNSTLTLSDATKVEPLIDKLRVIQPWKLVEMTHYPGGPWDTVFKNGAGNREIINWELLKKDITEL